jgi:ATP-dependent helicase/DNAse subunit B
MDLHVYRNSQDRWHDVRSVARERGAVLAINAVTVDELVQRITPDVKTATLGQRLVAFQGALARAEARDYNLRYVADAVSELKSARIRSADLRSAGAVLLADLLAGYDEHLQKAKVSDPQDRRALAAARIREGAVPWLQRFDRVVLHALYDLTEAEFQLVSGLIETLPEGGAVMLFNSTTNIKPTQFAEWTWQRFIQNESLAEKTFPEFCRTAQQSRAVLDKLFVFEPHEPLPADDSLRIVETSGRYKEAETIGREIADLLERGETPNQIVLVVRHIDIYGEMLEDVFTRYGIPHAFETGVPLLRIPFVKYWLSLLDLVTSDRAREGLARVMSSAYFDPRLSPGIDVQKELAAMGYIDRQHLRASALAARKNSPLTAELQRFENFLDDLENFLGTVADLLGRVQPSRSLSERDRQAWRVLAEELESVGSSGEITFAAFRKLASEIAGLRTVDRLSGAVTAPGLPRVRIISPHSLGSRYYKWIFAPGFADGEFPGRASSNPLLNDTTVEAINSRIRPRRLLSVRDRNRREPLYLFMILDSASNRVTLTYPNSTLEGESMYPSVYVAEIARHYEESPVIHQFTDSLPRGEGEWRSKVAEEWRKGRLTEARVRLLLGDNIADRANLEGRGKLRAHLGRDAIRIDGTWHPSELNALDSCPFVFLSRHRLRLRAPQMPDFEVPASEIGILAHNILKDFYSQPVPPSADEAHALMRETIARRLAAADVNGQGPYSVFDPSLWKIRRRQLVSVLNQYVEFALRDAAHGFQTQPEYLDSPLPPAQIAEVTLGGKPDHVAVHRDDGRIDAIRIDDFKYSAASSTTARQLKQSFQIPVYAYLAARALNAGDAVRIEGRYLLLRSPGNPVVSYALDKAVFEEVRFRIEALLRKVRDGELMPDPADKQGCAQCDYRRLCRLYGV